MTLRRIDLPRGDTTRRGSALIVIMVVVLMLIGLVGSITMTATARSGASIERRGRTQALGAAESGIALTLEKIIESDGAALRTDDAATITANPMVYQVPGGQVTVTTVEMAKNGLDDDGSGDADDDKEAGVVRVHARATIGQAPRAVTRTLEAFLVTQQHEAFYKAVFVGNDTDVSGYVLNFGPGNGNPRAPANDRPQRQRDSRWDTNSHSQNADYVEGDVYINGTLQVTGQSDVFGDIQTTGALVGRPTSGTTSEGVDRITPPDLAAQDYESMADIVVDASTTTLPSFMRDEESSSYYGSTLGASSAHDRPYFHLGDHAGKIDISASDSGKLVYVKGNLWIHSTRTLDAVFPSGRDAHVTVVVEGNVYIADDVQYSGDRDGLLIIAKSKEGEESFNDVSLNYRWDAGEPILNDDGTGSTRAPVRVRATCTSAIPGSAPAA